MIQIYSASAGSGKTHTLTRTYLELLLSYRKEGGASDPFGFRHILAVTFTNKATDEMKSRILSELSVLSTDVRSSDYYRDFVTDGTLVPKVYPDEESLRRASRECLVALLHDYGSFSVSTIDSFVQMTLKAFCREIGQLASYRVELDRNSLVSECVDRILDSLDGASDTGILDWIVSETLDRLEDGKRVNVDKIMLDEALKIKGEAHRNAVMKLSPEEASELYSTDKIARMKKQIGIARGTYAGKMKSLSNAVDAQMRSCTLDCADFKKGAFSSLIATCRTWKPWQSYPEVNATTSKAIGEDPLNWFPKAKAGKAASVTGALESALADLVGFCMDEKQKKVYNTLKIISEHIFGLELARRLNEEYDALAKEKNVLDIGDSNTALREIIGGSDAPFIYERIGVRYEHFLLDEFQDTSRVQWENFYPLLKESCSNGRRNLIVGDIKQSIYRFRDTDWTLLGSEVQRSFRPDETLRINLECNFRSGSRIVNFNNTMFPALAAKLERELEDKFGPAPQGMDLGSIYSSESVQQKIRKSFPGAVKAVFCPKEDEDEVLRQCVVHAHDDLGFRYSDITVLVRGHSGGGRAASVLSDAGINVITDDSLNISSSTAVRELVSLMSAIDNPDDSLATALCEDLAVDTSSRDYISIYDLAEGLVRDLTAANETLMKSEALYVQDFMDFLLDYEARQSGSLHLFLKEWDMRKDKLKVCSSKSIDAVTIMTVHKSKGLAAPYVIVAYLEDFELTHQQQTRWCTLDSGNSGIDDCFTGVYSIRVDSQSSRDSYMGKECAEEIRMQYIDNLNLLYVATTRSRQALCLVGRNDPSGRDRRSMCEVVKEYFDSLGQYSSPGADGRQQWLCDDDEPICIHDNEKPVPIAELPCEFPSWELSCKKVSDVERDMEFFSSVQSGPSPRLRGVVLHDILASVRVPSDLDGALEHAVISGELPEVEADAVKSLLSSRIRSAASRGWFPEDDSSIVLNEAEILASDGTYHRPDRVIRTTSGVVIVDYKFGSPRGSYSRQVREYASLYTAMGYKVSGCFLWYVDRDESVDVPFEQQEQ
ncbi:MAG: UvrD-helicase domain-containing protein [Bacteroidales bacterium]|nr:UvrD-helicase domain-containing protein [Bacteroidales bacterium]